MFISSTAVAIDWCVLPRTGICEAFASQMPRTINRLYAFPREQRCENQNQPKGITPAGYIRHH